MKEFVSIPEKEDSSEKMEIDFSEDAKTLKKKVIKKTSKESHEII